MKYIDLQTEDNQIFDKLLGKTERWKWFMQGLCLENRTLLIERYLQDLSNLYIDPLVMHKLSNVFNYAKTIEHLADNSSAPTEKVQAHKRLYSFLNPHQRIRVFSVRETFQRFTATLVMSLALIAEVCQRGLSPRVRSKNLSFALHKINELELPKSPTRARPLREDDIPFYDPSDYIFFDVQEDLLQKSFVGD